MKVKVTESWLTSCDPMDYTVHGILQAIILEWVAVPSPGDPLDPGTEPRSPTSQADSLLSEPPRKQCDWYRSSQHTMCVGESKSWRDTG